MQPVKKIGFVFFGSVRSLSAHARKIFIVYNVTDHVSGGQKLTMCEYEFFMCNW